MAGCPHASTYGWVGQSQLPLIGGVSSLWVLRPLVHLVKSIVMSAWPSCTSVKVSGVTSLHTCRASATVCRTCSRTSCHGNRRILGGGGGAWASLGTAPCWLMGQELPLGAQRGGMQGGHKPGVLWASAVIPLPQGNIFVRVCMSFGAHRCLHLVERTQNQEEPQDPLSRPDCATCCGGGTPASGPQLGFSSPPRTFLSSDLCDTIILHVSSVPGQLPTSPTGEASASASLPRLPVLLAHHGSHPHGLQALIIGLNNDIANA